MARTHLRILHAIHDFLPRHQAGSEIYAADLCAALTARGHGVSILCATYDHTRPHGHVAWRPYRSVPVAEITNNWVCETFEDTYRSPVMRERIESVLDAVQPDVLHVHNLLNLSFDLPELAHARGIPVVATLHDYTLVCPSGGQRLHQREQFVCREIDTTRCARCFSESSFGVQAAFGRIARHQPTGQAVAQLARLARRMAPNLLTRVTEGVSGLRPSPQEVQSRLDRARQLFESIDLFVSPSPFLASEFRQLGVPPARIRISDYGFPTFVPAARQEPGCPLRIGFAGTLVWHKGAHVLIDAVKRLSVTSYELRLFGDPEVFPAYSADLRVQSTGLPVRWCGAFDRDDVARVYGQIDVLVVPSLWLENSPLVIHEAFMAGVPVVGARTGGIADLVRHGENGFLYEPTDAGELATLLQRLIDRPAIVTELRDRAGAVKSIDQDAAEWERAYEAVLSKAHSSPLAS